MTKLEMVKAIYEIMKAKGLTMKEFKYTLTSAAQEKGYSFEKALNFGTDVFNERRHEDVAKRTTKAILVAIIEAINLVVDTTTEEETVSISEVSQMETVIMVLKDGKPFKVFPQGKEITAIKCSNGMNQYYIKFDLPERFTVEEINIEKV